MSSGAAKNPRAAKGLPGQNEVEILIPPRLSRGAIVNSPPLVRIAQSFQKATRPAVEPGESDRDLLARFVRQRDETAFQSLVVRHGKTVLTACRQVLADPADIDDAFQATFLVLLRKAKSVDAATPLAGWLFAVAHRVAVRCRSDNRRRQSREAEAARRTRTATELPDLSWREAVAILHDELNSLPDKYRLPLLLCAMQGLTRDEAAEQLGTTVGAVRGQLDRGRALLERRLVKRGIALSAGLLAVLMGNSRSAGGPPAKLIDQVVSAIGGHTPAAVDALARGVFPMMTPVKHVILPALLVFGLIGAGLAFGTGPSVVTAEEKPAAGQPRQPTQPPVKADVKGEPKKAAVKDRTITGKVIDADGKPIQAELHLIGIEGKQESLGKTKADGTFKVTMPLIEPGAWLTARAAGHGFDFMMPATNTPAEVTFKLPKDVPIRGRILDPQGMPVAAANVRVLSVREYGDGTIQPFLDAWKKRTHFRQDVRMSRMCNVQRQSLFTIKTDAEGRFELTGVGGERLVELRVGGAGRARTDAFVITRSGFDPKPLNEVTLGLRPTSGGEQLSWSFNPILLAPDFTLAVEPEKLIRGTVTDAKTGKPRTGARVTVRQDDGLRMYTLSATTNGEGKYVIHGAKKWRSYTVKSAMDTENGYLPSSVGVNDTAGYEPVVVDMPCVKGVIVTGTLRDKSTGKPVAGHIDSEVLSGNEFAKQHPVLGKLPQFEREFIKADGKYRRVILPGPMLLAAGISSSRANEYKPPVPDPKFPDLFHNEFGALGYYGPGGLMGFVNGNWCKVIDAKETDSVITQDIEFELGLTSKVQVTDAAGKPVTGAHATGLHHINFYSARPVGDTDTIKVYNVEPEKDRLVAAIHRKKKLVGALVFRLSDSVPVLQLDSGGVVTGRVLDEKGQPRAGITVWIHFDRREVEELYGGLNNRISATTDANGEFRFETILPGYEFRFLFTKGKTRFGPDYAKAAKHTIAKHGDRLKLGDLKLEPASDAKE
jgi:RNA polymerase sigma factor (sigma-70 family)